jgi:hypothetical protein
MAIDLRKIVLIGNLPEGWSGTPQELLEKFAELARVELSEEDGAGGTVQIGGAAPTTQNVIWIDTTNPLKPRLNVYIGGIRAEYGLPFYLPIGAMIAFPAPSTDHPDWVECDNRELTVLDYPELYDAIGNHWGGDATKFNVPDMRGRVPMGANSSDTTRARGIDWWAGGTDKKLIDRPMNGSEGPSVGGDEPDAAGNHPGYPGHDFGVNKPHAGSGRPTTPQGQYTNLEPATGGEILQVIQPSTIVRWFIKAR